MIADQKEYFAANDANKHESKQKTSSCCGEIYSLRYSKPILICAHQRKSAAKTSFLLNSQIFPLLIYLRFGLFVHQDFVGPGAGEALCRPFARSVDAHL